MGALSSSSTLIIRHIFRSPPHLSNFALFKQPTLALRTFLPPLFSSSSSSSSSPICCLSTNNFQTPQTPIVESDVELETDDTQIVGPEKETVFSEADLNSSKKYEELVAKLPSLSVKEKKELASYAHSIGKKLKSQQVGKSGVTDSVAIALVETLEANELLKVKIHTNIPAELDEVVKQLEGATGSVVVSRIGRTVILYRPSLTKLKAEEKKIQARRIFVRRQAAFKSSLQNKARAQALGQSGLRRGRSRQ